MQTVPIKAVCMKCQILFSKESKINIINLLRAKFAQIVVEVNVLCFVSLTQHTYNIATVSLRRDVAVKLWWHCVFAGQDLVGEFGIQSSK